MTSAMTLYGSTIGKKAIMALTGLILFGFTIGHMVGNLKVFQGPEKLNSYGAFLHSQKELLWGARIVLLIAVLAHIVAAVQLTRLNLASRPTGYARKQYQRSGFAARTLRWGGIILALFIIYHILHLTVITGPGSSLGQEDVYGRVVAGFQVWYISAFYIAAMVALGFHLYHGGWSMLQTLGLTDNNFSGLLNLVTKALAFLVVLGNISIPAAILVGLVK